MKIAKLFIVFLMATCICGCDNYTDSKPSKNFVVLDSNSSAYKYLFYKRGTKEKYKDVKINETMGVICSSEHVYNSPNKSFWTPGDGTPADLTVTEKDLVCIEMLADRNCSSVSYMEKSLEESDFNCSRSGMILAIGMLGKDAKDMVPRLIAKLSHFPTPTAWFDQGYDSQGKTLIVTALGKIALESEELRPQILTALKDWQGKDPDVRVETAILEMLWLLGDKDEEKLSLLELRRHIWLLSEGIPSNGYNEKMGETLNYAYATDELGLIKDKYAVSALIRCLHRNYWRAPGNAALSLGNFKDDPRAMPALVDAFGYHYEKYPWSVDLRVGITQGLKNLGFDSKEQTIPILTKNLESKDREVLLLSIKALRQLGPLAKTSLPKLKEIAEKDGEKYFRDFAELAIKAIEDEKKD